jgi:hypothetical protein
MIVNIARARQLIDRAIQTFSLNLQGCTVLTEAATGAFALTPLIAALAGVDTVLALTRDSRYGTAAAAEAAVRKLAKAWNVESKIDVLFSREEGRIGSADIITNLGFVRPLDAVFLACLKPTAVIPLMCETWEWRKADLDLAECRRRRIPVLGTNEYHDDLQTFGYIGYLAVKLLLEAGIEVFRSQVIVLGHGEFAEHAVTTLKATGVEVDLLSPDSYRGRLIPQVREQIRRADAMVVVEHHARDLLIGPGGMIEAGELAALNPALTILHICGDVDQSTLQAAGLVCHPEKVAPAGYMSVTTAYLGPKPLVDLHAAGLKVGEVLWRARMQGLHGRDAERRAAASCSLARAFADNVVT